MIEGSVSRRVWFTALVSGAGAVATACQPAATNLIDTAQGQVLQWESGDVIALVSGFHGTYRLGETIDVTIIVNNQGAQVLEVRVRTKVLALGDQPIIQSEPALLTIPPGNAGKVDRRLAISRSLPVGSYTLSVEIPPWKVNGREAGKGAALRAPLRFDASG